MKNIDTSTLGGIIKYNILKNDYTYNDIANYLKVQIRTIHIWENNLIIPRQKYIVKIEKIFNINLNKFYNIRSAKIKIERPVTYGDYIKNFRHENNLSLEELAKILKVGARSITCWEKNYSIPSLKNKKNIESLMPTIIFSKSENKKLKQKYNDNTLGSYISKRRIEKNYSQLELSKKIKCGEKTVRRWENNLIKPSIKFRKILEKVLDINLNNFYKIMKV